MQTQIQGQLERITYANEETGYTIGKLKVKGHRDLVAFIGNLMSANPGEILRLKGQWYNHPKYGEQFKVETYESIIPATVVGIEKYLSSSLIKGIGPVMARRIVSKYGIKTLDIIETQVDKLIEIDGIGKKRVVMIEKAWIEQKEIKEVMLFLQGNGVSTAYATKIFKHYGKESIRIVKDNPYRLATDIFGIGFITADKIAMNMGIEKDSIIRVEAGILYCLHQLSNEGHVYYPYELLIRECNKVLNVKWDIIVGSFEGITKEEMIKLENINNDEKNNKAVYLTKFYITETGIAKNLKLILNAKKIIRKIDIDKAIEWAEKEQDIILAENQKLAVRKSLSDKILVITGGPGTGKTTIINSVIKIYKKSGEKVLLCAPTGRAAKRMSELTGCEAKTIHRLLEFSPKDGKFIKNEEKPLDASLIVIDEASMVDTILMHYFLKAVPLSATLIIVGDVCQIPSVGAGNVLKDIIDSETVSTVMLNEIFRQSRQSKIIVNAHRINNGQMPLFTTDESKIQDFYFITVEEPENILSKIILLCKERIPNKFRYAGIKDIQVLTPMNKGLLGARNLNIELQKSLNPTSNELVRGGRTFKKGDKVMQIVNNYDKNVYNGDIGVITEIDNEVQEFTIDFEDRIIVYEYSDLDEIVLAYAVSIHKAQGSEYPVIVMPIHTQHYMLLQRNLLYTGITRGRKLVILIGTKKAVEIAINNNTPHKRYTRLRERLV